MPKRLVLTVLGFSLAACSSDSHSRTIEAQIADSAGVEIISVTGSGSLGALTAIETLRLGAIDAEGPEQFSGVFAVDISDDGAIFVGDNASGTVRIFDDSGRFIRAVGGRGQGPGEVGMVFDVVAFGDSVAIIDGRWPGKLVTHPRDGSTAVEKPLGRPDESSIGPIHRARDGWYASVGGPVDFGGLDPGASRVLTSDIFLLSPEFEPSSEPLFSYPTETLYGIDEIEGMSDFSLFPARRFRGFDARDRLYLTRTQAYDVEIHGRDGLERIVRRDIDLVQITDALVDAYRDVLLDAVDERTGGDPGQRESFEDRLAWQAEMPIPEFIPPIAGLLVADDGSFWVRVADPDAFVERQAERWFITNGGAEARPTTWDLFDPEGGYLGQVELPPCFRPEAVLGREVVGVMLDEFDVEHVVRYEIRPTA